MKLKNIFILLYLFIIFSLFSDSYKYELKIIKDIKDIPYIQYTFVSSDKIIFLDETHNLSNTELYILNINNMEKKNIIWDFIVTLNISGKNDKLLFKKHDNDVPYVYGIGDLYEYDIITNTINKIPLFYNKNKDGAARWLFSDKKIVYEKIKRKNLQELEKIDVYVFDLKTKAETLIKENAIIVDSNNNYLLLSSTNNVETEGIKINNLFLMNNKNEIKECFLKKEIKDILHTKGVDRIKLYNNENILLCGANELNILDIKDNKIYKVKNTNYYISSIRYNFESDIIVISYIKKKLFKDDSGIYIGKIEELATDY